MSLGMLSSMTTNSGQRPWLSNQDLADRYGVPIDTVRKWRHEGTGPKGVRFGRHVRYDITECERWEREQATKQVARSA